MKRVLVFININLIMTSFVFTQGITSPKTYDFVRYGSIPVSMYTGQIDLNVPIYNYKDQDFNINIEAIYSSNGFMPAKRESEIGLGWFLNAGGVITRTVYGIPDDYNTYSSSDGELAGYYLLTKDHNFDADDFDADDFAASNYYDFDGTVVKKYNDEYYEVEPDIFNFRFQNLSGKFYIGPDGYPVVICDRPCTVDLSGFNPQDDLAFHSDNSSNQIIYDNSEIRITDENGYIYVFGGNENCLEVDMKGAEDYEVDGHNALYDLKITSWYLSQIIAPNSRTVYFNYRKPDYSDPNFEYLDIRRKFPKNGEYYLNITKGVYNVYKQEELNAFSYSFLSLDNYSFYKEYSTTGTAISYSVTKGVVLESIDIGNCTIDFDYSQKDYFFYKKNDLNISPKFTDIYNNQLNDIYVKYDDRIEKTVSFNYSTSGGIYERSFLDEIVLADGGIYSFDYYMPYSIPPSHTDCIDHWGYWKGGTSTDYSNLLPSVDFDANYNQEITNTKRDPNAAYALEGMLKEISYPTGGRSIIHYEGNDYSKKLDRRSDNDFLPNIYSENGNGGGLRVSLIMNYINNVFENSITYKYVTGYQYDHNSSTSSGELYKWPTYGNKNHIIWEDNTGWNGFLNYSTFDYEWIYSVIRSTSCNYMNYNDPIVAYSEVVKIQNDDFYTINKYSTYSSNPDLTDYQLSYTPSEPVNLRYVNMYVELGDLSCERGKIVKSTEYNNSDKPVREKVYGYNTQNSQLIGKTPVPISLDIVGEIKYLNNYIYNLTNETVIDYFYDALGSQSDTSSTITYTYNNLGQLQSTKTTNSQNVVQKTTYKYPSDYSFPTQAMSNYAVEAIYALNEKNMISTPLEVTEYKNGLVTNSSLTTYKYDASTNLPNPYLIYKLKTSSPLTYAAEGSDSYTTFTPSYVKSMSPYFIMDNYYITPNTQFDKYDANGNLLQYHNSEDINTSYVWGYNNTYLTAKIENAEVGEIAYTSFESLNEGNWSFNSGTIVNDALLAKTGKTYFIMNGAPTIYKSLPVGTYRLEYWSKATSPTINGGTITSISTSSADSKGWIQYIKELTLSTATTIYLTGYNIDIDELRLYPSDAQMTTYTYDPLVGMTSETAPNGVTTYYEYDAFGRLWKVKDQDGNIIKQYEYHYANQ